MEPKPQLTEEEIRQQLKKTEEGLVWATDTIVIQMLAIEREWLQNLADCQPPSNDDTIGS